MFVCVCVRVYVCVCLEYDSVEKRSFLNIRYYDIYVHP